MRCPSCDQNAITFAQWTRGSSAFRTQCASCGASLTATPVTYVLFGLTLVVGVAAAIWGPEILGLDLGRGASRLLILLPVVIVGAGLGWFAGGYRLAGG